MRYNIMRYNNQDCNSHLHDVLAQARALRYAVIHKAISYEDAKKKSETFLKIANNAGEKIAKKYRMKYRKIRFSDL